MEEELAASHGEEEQDMLVLIFPESNDVEGEENEGGFFLKSTQKKTDCHIKVQSGAQDHHYPKPPWPAEHLCSSHFKFHFTSHRVG